MKRNRNFILIEVILGITILGLSLFSLVGFPLRLFSKHQSQIKQSQIKRILSIAEIHLLQEWTTQIPWLQLPKAKEKTPLASYHFQTNAHSYELEYTVQCQGEYKRDHNVYKLLCIQLRDKKSRLAVERKFIAVKEDLS